MVLKGKHVLGIDLGTSSCKVAITDAAGKIVDSGMVKYGLNLIDQGGAEQVPDDWWKSIVKAVHGMLERNEGIGKSVVSVCVVGQFSGTVPVDRNGVALRNAIIWMDTRGEPYVRQLTGGFPGISGYRIDKLMSWLRKTGGAPAHSGKDSISHILYLMDHEPDLCAQTFKFLEPKDYINLKLTGKFTASFDSMVLHWVTDNRDPDHVKYDPGLLRLAGLDQEKLPEMKQSAETISTMDMEAANELGIPQEARVVAGAGDMQSSLVGSGCTRDFQTELYLGTSSWITSHVPFKKTSLRSNIASLPSAVPGRYFIAAEQESAGVSLEFAREMLFDNSHRKKLPGFDEMDRSAALSPPGSDGLIFLPWLYGERAPVEDKNLRGAFFNLSLKSSRSDMIRAVLEGVALNLNWLLDPVERLSGKRADPIRMAGGGAMSALWPQILSDVLGRNVQVVEDPIFVNARGAALLASAGAGMITFDGIADVVPIRSELKPDERNHITYSRMFRKFLELYVKNRRSFTAGS